MKSLLTIMALLLLQACSGGGKSSEAKLSIGMYLTEDATFSGGMLVRLVSSTGTIQNHEFSAKPYLITVPQGIWTFHIVGYGTSPFSGATHCGSSLPVSISGESATVDINATTANCNAEVFASMMYAKGPVIGRWSQSFSRWSDPKILWGP